MGLSRWTVSRVINGHSGVRAETVARVRQAMEELGYEPNAFARGLRGGKTGIVGICFQELDNPILTRKAGLLQAAFRERGYRAMIELTNGDRERETEAIRIFMGLRVEGIVLLGSSLSDEDSQPLAQVPLVWVDPEKKVSGEQISVDRAYSMKLVLEHLHGLGHRRFAVLGIDPENPYGAFRWPAFLQYAKELNIYLAKDVTILYQSGRMDHTYDYGREMADQLLAESSTMPTAVVALNDRVAIGAINRFREAGLRVPDDISIAGYDNLDISGHFRPTLTTVDQHESDLMQMACDALIDRIEGGKEVTQPRLVRPLLVTRNSTGPVPKR
ncbi:LacI family DNA-binding transcriptional regulator [Rubellicoccus peritrichatus]|uniref:LacI family DNA-binding transcriptional regulator n=1 Tax=Rubellicoccus peritrichatus TaxID=3080537 RepID=A0AAQ3LH16_9BACT|nr:LacI family DNA-binding transcriptional regulator [Puniceicoccus sp. CR14]WOO43735.1 LacI family DNA-binding transcriptional regulator [Puniceicoccus sp. CR14]